MQRTPLNQRRRRSRVCGGVNPDFADHCYQSEPKQAELDISYHVLHQTETGTDQFQIVAADKQNAAAAGAKPCKGGEAASAHCSGKGIEATQNGPYIAP